MLLQAEAEIALYVFGKLLRNLSWFITALRKLFSDNECTLFLHWIVFLSFMTRLIGDMILFFIYELPVRDYVNIRGSIDCVALIDEEHFITGADDK